MNTGCIEKISSVIVNDLDETSHVGEDVLSNNLFFSKFSSEGEFQKLLTEDIKNALCLSRSETTDELERMRQMQMA